MRSIRSLILPAALLSPAFAVPEGFEIHEFAGPPNVDYPAAITAAANGDLYVSSDKNGSLGKEKSMGSIVRCRDTNGDGTADEFVAYVPDVDSPRGGHFVGDTLYLIHPPYLSAFRDTTGDGVADQKELLVTGFGGGIEHPRGADHTTNGVRMGIDGWLYVSVGDFGMADAEAADGARYTLFGGGVVRIRPDGSEMEPYALMTRNICDTAISPELDLFSRDNTNDGKGWNTRFHHYTALGDHGYPRLYKNFEDEAITPLADYGGGSGTGALWLAEPGFPGDFGNMLLSCDWTTGNIYYHPSKKDGSSFRIEQEIFHELPRATDIDVDGSSRLYLSDWRDGRFVFAGEGVPVGMIHQVTAPGTDPARYSNVARANDEDLSKLLASSSAVQRLEAQREILKRGQKPAFAKAIFKLAKDSKQEIGARVAAIFTLKQLYGRESTPHLAELSTDPEVREFALRAMTDRLSELEGVPVELYTRALEDPNPRVVLQAIIGLERLKADSTAAKILAASSSWTEQSISPRLRHTAIAALASLGDVEACLEAAKDPALRQLALGALQRLHRMDVVEGLGKLANASDDPQLQFEILIALSRLYFTEEEWDLKFWWGTRPDDRGPYYHLAEWPGTAIIRTALEQGFTIIRPELQGDYLEALAGNRVPITELDLPGLDPVLAALGNSEPTDADLTLLTTAAIDVKRQTSQRLACYRALARGKDLKPRLEVLASWAEETSAPSEFADAISDFVNATERGIEIKELRKLAAGGSDAQSRIAWRSMLTTYSSPLSKAAWKKQVQAFIDKNPREVGFFEAIADLKLSGFDKQIEVGLTFDNDELIAAAKAAKKAVSSEGVATRKIAAMTTAEAGKIAMEGKGDIKIGERLFTSQGCIACHSVDMNAEQKGPYLGSAGSKFTRDYLIDSILEPNKVVAQGFQTSLLTMKDGDVKMGFITGEEDGTVQLRDIAGQSHQLKRASIEKEDHLPQSMMPPGLAGTLSPEDFTSLIEYLVSLKSDEE